MNIQEGNLSRRGSLAISALLNDDTVNLNTQLSGDMSSGTTSPVNGSSKAKRKRISPVQYNRLMEIFDQTDTPSSEIRENLAEELDMTKREVQVWFQNRRAKVNRTKNLQLKQSHRHSLIPTNNLKIGLYHEVKPRRASAYPVLENNDDMNKSPQSPYSPTNHGRSPIAPYQQSQPHSLPPLQQSHHHSSHSYHPYYNQRKPSAIDLLASAAEYVRADHKEMTFSRS